MSGISTKGNIAPLINAIPEGSTASEYARVNDAVKTLAEACQSQVEVVEGVLAAATSFNVSKPIARILSVLTVDKTKKSWITNAPHTYTIDSTDKTKINIAGGALAGDYNAQVLYAPAGV